MADIENDANVSSYEVRITNPYGVVLLTLETFSSLDYARKVNEIGALSLTVIDNGEVGIYEVENRVEVWRIKDGTGKLDMDGMWFIHTVKRTKAANDAAYIEVLAHDQIGLLERRIVPYNEGNPTTEKQAEGDDVIKAIMRENFGALATDTDRDLSTYLTIQADDTLAPQVTKFFAKDNVYDIIKEIAETCYENGTFLAFDIIYNPNVRTFEFRTYVGQRGVDRSVLSTIKSLILGIEFESLTSIIQTDTRKDEKNYVYAGAKDLVGIVPAQTAINTTSIGLSPFHRKELFLNASSADDASELQAEADAALDANKYRPRFEVELSENFVASSYGDTLLFGDKVSVSFDGLTYSVFVDAINVTIDKNGEKIDVVLVGADE